MRDRGVRRTFLSVLLFGSVVFAQDDAPSVDTYLRRGGSRVSVIGDYAYFHGGEVAQEGYTDFRMTNLVNSTLSIDLSSSWTSEDVEIREISTPDLFIPHVKQAIFTDQSSETFYIWGGHSRFGEETEDPVLWQFAADGEGGGRWTTRDDSPGLDSMERVESGIYVSTPDRGFVFGGLSSAGTSLEPRGDMSGYVSFDFESGEWNRESNAPFNQEGIIYGGTAAFAPDFGPNGIIVVLGGLASVVEDDYDYIDFQTLHLLDPVTGEWYSQETSGDAPSGRHFHCSAGATSTNGTYEIFVYGGFNRNQNTYYSDIYALSLPGFRWTRATDLPTDGRAEHVCAVVGNRQMISWGGVEWDTEAENAWHGADPFPQGIGIFDMTAMEWRDEYDASAEPYESHPRIQAWYDEGGMDTIEWSTGVRQLFVVEEEEDDTNNDGNNNRAGNNPDDEETDDSRGSGTPVGAIAGGVVGGVAGLALLGVGIWLFFRRRRQEQQVRPALTTEVSGESKVSELPPSPLVELPYNAAAAEARRPDHMHIAELDEGGYGRNGHR